MDQGTNDEEVQPHGLIVTPSDCDDSGDNGSIGSSSGTMSFVGSESQCETEEARMRRRWCLELVTFVDKPLVTGKHLVKIFGRSFMV